MSTANPPPVTPYDRTFFSAQATASLRSARAVVPIVVDLARPRSVVDVGCGVGAWLAAFAEAGVGDYLGLDGDYLSRDQLLVPADRFRPADLIRPAALDRRFDLAVSLEVAEHLPPAAGPGFVEYLTAAAPLVLFSAAVPGQHGTRHVNLRWPGYWQRLFEARGYVRLDPVRPRVWREPAVEWWYKQNTYLFAARDRVAADPALAAEAELAAANPFELLHADTFGPLTTVTGLARAVPAAVRQVVARVFGRG